jgi:uncharacterized protein
MAIITLFDAARKCDAEATDKLLQAGADVSAFNDNGFTALQCAAMGSNACNDESKILDTIKLLVNASSPLEAKSKDGRTALFLLAEFSPFIAPVQYLFDAGANPDVSDQHGNHITENAMLEEVQELLSTATGVALLPAPDPRPAPVKMGTKAWRQASQAVSTIFEELNRSGLIALADAGYTQSDGFSDCAQALHDHPAPHSIAGFCFYTRQDINTAKQTSQLYLGIWGAPEGGDNETIAIGQQVIQAFKRHGFEVYWNETAAVRPCILLYHFNS